MKTFYRDNLGSFFVGVNFETADLIKKDFK